MGAPLLKLPPPRLEQYYERWNAIAPLKLSASSAEPLTLAQLLELAGPEERELWQDLGLGYASSAGDERLREEIASLYRGLGAREVFTFAGAQEAIFCTLVGLLERGDHVVNVRPAYEFLDTIPRGLGCAVDSVELRVEGNRWRLDLDRLEAALQPNTKLIAVNFPHNPTGAALSEEELRLLARLAAERGAWLFSDEVFRLLPAEGAEPATPIVELYERGISLDVMSKSFGLGGVRVGWIATRSADVLRSAARVNGYTSICNGTADELLALIALRARDRILARNREIVAANREAASACFQRWQEWIEWTPPSAGCLAFPRLRGDWPVEELAARLAEREGTLLLPGAAFLSAENRFRLGLGQSGLPAALEGLARELDKEPGELRQDSRAPE